MDHNGDLFVPHLISKLFLGNFCDADVDIARQDRFMSSMMQSRRFRIWNVGGDPNLGEVREERAESPLAAYNATPLAETALSEEELLEPYVKALREAPQAIELDGLCELPNGLDRSCRTKSIGPQAIDIVYQDAMDAGDKRQSPKAGFVSGTVQFDLDQVGKFQGVLTTQTPDGFQVAVDPKFSGLLLTKLARYMARGITGHHDHRAGQGNRSASERIVPANSFCTYRDRNGILNKGTLVNISRLDALVKTRSLPELNSLITFSGRRQRRAHVIRCLESGFAALFVDPLVEQEFSAEIVLADEFGGR
jgi:hypothetical protein